MSYFTCPAYFENVGKEFVSIDRELELDQSEVEWSKQKDALDKAKKKYPTAVGILKGKSFSVLFLSEGKWSCYFYASRQTFSGSYKK